jgi:ribosomal protein L24
MSNYTNIRIKHDESDADMSALVQAQAGNNLLACNKLQNYVAAIGAGIRRAVVEVGVGADKASGTITADTAVADNTVVINGVTLTAKASPSGANQFALGSNDDDAATNLAAKINASALALISGYVTAEKTEVGVANVTSVTCVADVAASLDGKFFIVQDNAGSVAFWIDVDNAGGSAPTHGADRAVEITTVTTGMTAPQVAGVVATAVNADSKLNAAAVGSVVTVTDAFVGARGAADAGDSGFTVASVTAGVDPVVTITAVDPGIAGNCMTLAGTGGLVASGARLTAGSEGTELTHYYSMS